MWSVMFNFNFYLPLSCLRGADSHGFRTLYWFNLSKIMWTSTFLEIQKFWWHLHSSSIRLGDGPYSGDIIITHCQVLCPVSSRRYFKMASAAPKWQLSLLQNGRHCYVKMAVFSLVSKFMASSSSPKSMSSFFSSSSGCGRLPCEPALRRSL